MQTHRESEAPGESKGASWQPKQGVVRLLCWQLPPVVSEKLGPELASPPGSSRRHFPKPSVFTLQWNSRECEGACKLDNVSFLGAWEGEANTFLFLLYRMQSFSALALFTFWPDRNSLFGAG